jgi:GTP pyrophosphokinase
MTAPKRTASKNIQKALKYATKAHMGQKRTSGEPYITHLTAVADLLRGINADEETLIAALLHDTVEDTDVTYDDLKKEFGVTIAKLVEGVTKVRHFEKTMDKREQNMLAIRKLFRTMGKDIRVIFIKLADRLHNMQTIKFVAPEKQLRVARETQDIYCHLADLLGIRMWYQQLSDACFEIIEPAAYDLIRRKFEAVEKNQRTKLEEWTKHLKEVFPANIRKKIVVELAKRHEKSIYDRIRGQENLLQHIETFYRVHVVIPDTMNCYAFLGNIHMYAPPIPGNMDDYIAMPKVNGYQALHTTVITTLGNPIDVIIQTKSMAEQAQFGTAMLYKMKRKKNEVIALPEWVEALTSLEEDEKDLQRFFSMIQTEIFGEQSRVYINGKKKKYIDLPDHASLLDVAYYVNEKTGQHAESAILNNKPVNLKHPVKDGDVVELVLGPKESAPRNALDLYYINTGFAHKLLVKQLSELPKDERAKRGSTLVTQMIDVAMDPFFSITWQKQVRNRMLGHADAVENVGVGVIDPFIFLEEHSMPEDFFLVDPGCFSLIARASPGLSMRYVLRTSQEELRQGNIIGVQAGPDVIEVISADILERERRFSKEFVPLKVRKESVQYPLHFALRFFFKQDANPLEDIATLQSLLDTPVNLLRFEPTSVTLSFHTNRLRTIQLAYEHLYALPYISHIFRISP